MCWRIPPSRSAPDRPGGNVQEHKSISTNASPEVGGLLRSRCAPRSVPPQSATHSFSLRVRGDLRASAFHHALLNNAIKTRDSCRSDRIFFRGEGGGILDVPVDVKISPAGWVWMSGCDLEPCRTRIARTLFKGR